VATAALQVVVSSGSGVVRDCRHPRARHRHGTRQAYVGDHCHCDGCTAANRAAGTTRRIALAQGTWVPHTTAGAAVRHARKLQKAGFTVTAIAAAAGLARSTIRQLLQPHPPARIRTGTHRAVLAVPIPRRPTRRLAAPTVG
jgi:hypothetical protein